MADETLGELGELEVVRRLQRLLPGGSGIPVGIGDDAAVVRWNDTLDLVLTSDAVIEGIHFKPSADARQVGHKAMARALSDLAAMGADPAWAVLDLVAPATLSWERTQAMIQGLADTASQFGVTVVGGDTSCSDPLALHVFLAGRVPAGSAVLRSTAKAGDVIFVTGTLGGSLAGRHLRFAPRIAEGQWLRQTGWATAMMDVSDGLATDLPRLARASGVGIRVNVEDLPISSDVGTGGSEAVRHALTDGEDYELLFTVDAGRVAELEAQWPDHFELTCTSVGRLEEDPGKAVLLRADGSEMAWPGHGFEHFST